MPKVTVIIPVYNAEKHLVKCLESVVNQTLEDIEIICVDDGSTDNSNKILKEYEEKDLRIKVIEQENQYAGVARNNGMAIATGEFLSFLDSDDFFDSNMLEEMYGKCKSEDADICICGAKQATEDTNKGEELRWCLNKQFVPAESVFSRSDIPNHILQITNPAPWNKLFRLEFIKHFNLQFSNTINANDLYFTISALGLAGKITVVNEALVNYRTHAAKGLTESTTSLLHIIDVLNEVRKTFYRYDIYNEVHNSFSTLSFIQYKRALDIARKNKNLREFNYIMKRIVLMESDSSDYSIDSECVYEASLKGNFYCEDIMNCIDGLKYIQKFCDSGKLIDSVAKGTKILSYEMLDVTNLILLEIQDSSEKLKAYEYMKRYIESFEGTNEEENFTKASGFDYNIVSDLTYQDYESLIKISSYTKEYWGRDVEAAKNFKKFNVLPHFSKKVKVVGMYCNRLTGGGAERVVEFMTPILVEMGYRVVLVGDKQEFEDSFELPEGVKEYRVHPVPISTPEAYTKRASDINKIIRKENIDVFIYHACWVGALFWDLVTIKLSGSGFIAFHHTLFTRPLFSQYLGFERSARILSLADGVVCLSDVNKSFWGKFNSNVFAIDNPPTFDAKKIIPSKLECKNILWCGAFRPEKQVDHAMRIFEKVIKRVPDAKLMVLGTSPFADRIKSVEDLVDKLEISNNVEFLGHQNDVSPFYSKAAVMLVTSEVEGFPMALYEGKIFGLPIVLYELPYLTLSKGNRGMLPVPMGDIESAANYLIEMLTDECKRKEVGNEARIHALELAEYNHAKKWNEILLSLEKSRKQMDSDESEKIMWETLLIHHTYGLAKTSATFQKELREIRQKNNALYKELTISKQKNTSLQKQMGDLRGSLSFKCGRALTFVPRKVRGCLRHIKTSGIRATIKYSVELIRK